MTDDRGVESDTSIDPRRLLEVAQWKMPFGKYKGFPLLSLPEPYLVWFSQQGFPKGPLGEALALTLEIKVNGLEELVHPLMDSSLQR